MIIGVCGYGSSGSSAVSDYLMEFNHTCVLDKIEFTWVTCVDGLIDLEYHIMNPHGRTDDSVVAINRYIDNLNKFKRYYKINGGIDLKKFEKSIHDFIDSITDVKWYSYIENQSESNLIKKIKNVIRSKLIPVIERKRKKQLSCFPFKEVRLSVCPKNFYEAARKHVNELLEAMGADFSKPLILDQPFSGTNPSCAFHFFDDPHAIIVDRDPRDIYVFSKTKLLGRNHFMPNNSVYDFIKYFKAIRSKKHEQIESNRVLSIQFEEMVYDYYSATKKIRDFLGFPINPNEKSIFDPRLSINNTQVWRRYPQFKEDIEIIEKELPECLFDFSKYPEPDLSGEMFYGKSPLNRG